MFDVASAARRGLYLLLLAVPLVACDQDEEVADAGGATENTAREVQTFSPGVPEVANVAQSRLPVEGDRLIFVPATALFPGVARIDPDIQNPYAGDPEAIAAGERHFAAFNCAGCHAPLGGGGMGPPLSDGGWIYGGEPAQIFLSIMHGRAQGMPAWSSMLPAKTVWELVAYIDTLNEIEDPAAEKGFPKRNGRFAGAEGEESPPRRDAQ